MLSSTADCEYIAGGPPQQGNPDIKELDGWTFVKHALIGRNFIRKFSYLDSRDGTHFAGLTNTGDKQGNCSLTSLTSQASQVISGLVNGSTYDLSLRVASPNGATLLAFLDNDLILSATPLDTSTFQYYTMPITARSLSATLTLKNVGVLTDAAPEVLEAAIARFRSGESGLLNQGVENERNPHPWKVYVPDSQVEAASFYGLHFLPAQARSQIPEAGLEAWFKYSDTNPLSGEEAEVRNFETTNKTWRDSTGRHVGVMPDSSQSTVEWWVDSGNGATALVGYVRGVSRDSQFVFGDSVLKSEFTVCSLTRYLNGTEGGRILVGNSTQWWHGHDSGEVGVAHYGKWVTSQNGTRSQNHLNDWLIMCGQNKPYENYVVVNGNTNVTTSNGGTSDDSLVVNTGVGVEGGNSSSWAIAEVIVWNRHLNKDEINEALDYLQSLLDYGNCFQCMKSEEMREDCGTVYFDEVGLHVQAGSEYTGANSNFDRLWGNVDPIIQDHLYLADEFHQEVVLSSTLRGGYYLALARTRSEKFGGLETPYGKPGHLVLENQLASEKQAFAIFTFAGLKTARKYSLEFSAAAWPGHGVEQRVGVFLRQSDRMVWNGLPPQSGFEPHFFSWTQDADTDIEIRFQNVSPLGLHTAVFLSSIHLHEHEDTLIRDDQFEDLSTSLFDELVNLPMDGKEDGWEGTGRTVVIRRGHPIYGLIFNPSTGNYFLGLENLPGQSTFSSINQETSWMSDEAIYQLSFLQSGFNPEDETIPVLKVFFDGVEVFRSEPSMTQWERKEIRWSPTRSATNITFVNQSPLTNYTMVFLDSIHVEYWEGDGFEPISLSATCEINPSTVAPFAILPFGFPSLAECLAACRLEVDCIAVDYYQETQGCNLYAQACVQPQNNVTGGSSYRHIDVCRAVRMQETQPWGIELLPCQREGSKVCEVYEHLNSVFQGTTEGATCATFCNAYNLTCVGAFRDEREYSCARSKKLSCDEDDGITPDHICQCTFPWYSDLFAEESSAQRPVTINFSSFIMMMLLCLLLNFGFNSY